MIGNSGFFWEIIRFEKHAAAIKFAAIIWPVQGCDFRNILTKPGIFRTYFTILESSRVWKTYSWRDSCWRQGFVPIGELQTNFLDLKNNPKFRNFFDYVRNHRLRTGSERQFSNMKWKTLRWKFSKYFGWFKGTKKSWTHKDCKSGVTWKESIFSLRIIGEGYPDEQLDWGVNMFMELAPREVVWHVIWFPAVIGAAWLLTALWLVEVCGSLAPPSREKELNSLWDAPVTARGRRDSEIVELWQAFMCVFSEDFWV